MSVLAEILGKGYVDPKVLEQLDEEQKQILFIKMREEQLRKWRLWEMESLRENGTDERSQKKKQQQQQNNSRRVRWLDGRDGNVWVWVMGEHLDDLSVDQILENEAKEKARHMAENEIIRTLEKSENLPSIINEDEAALKMKLAKVYLNTNGINSNTLEKSTSQSPYDELPDESSTNEESEASVVVTGNTRLMPPFQNGTFTAVSTGNSTSDRSPRSSFASQEIYDNLVVPHQAPPPPHSFSSSSTISTFRPSSNSYSGALLFQNAQLSNRFVQNRSPNRFSENFNEQSRAKPPPVPEKPASLRRTISSNLGTELAPPNGGVDHQLEFTTVGSYVPSDELQKRQSKIFGQLKVQRERLEREAEVEALSVEADYDERKRKAREAEESVRRIAQRAREQHRKNMRTSEALLPLFRENPNGVNSVREALLALPRPPKPRNRQAILNWFWSSEVTQWRGKLPPNWFHGIIARDEAEKLLLSKQCGAFLVRVTERIFGYTVSYRADEGLKNFLVERIPDGYQFMGTNQLVHSTLTELVFHHQTHSITAKGGEILVEPVGQEKTPPDYEDLFRRPSNCN